MSESIPFPVHITRAAREDGRFSLAADGLNAVIDVLAVTDGDGSIDFEHPEIAEAIRASRARRQFHPSVNPEATAQLFRDAEQTASITILPVTEA